MFSQERKRIREVSSGIVVDNGDANDERAMPAVQIIPPLLQLYPEIEVEHADDTSALVKRAREGKWTWLFAGRTVYLVAPPSIPTGERNEGEDEVVMDSTRILHGKDIGPLISFYLAENKLQQ